MQGLCNPSAAAMVDELAYAVVRHGYKSVFVGADDDRAVQQMQALWRARVDVKYVSGIVVQ